MTRKAKITVTIALMLGMSLASLDTTIVGTALPSIVAMSRLQRGFSRVAKKMKVLLICRDHAASTPYAG